MKKTTPEPATSWESLPLLLWEKDGIRYPLLSGYRLRTRRGQQIVSIGGDEQGLFSQIQYKISGYRLIWDHPSPDLSPSLYRLWDHCFHQGLVRFWIHRRGTSRYEGKWMRVTFPSGWEGEYLDPEVPFYLTLWS